MNDPQANPYLLRVEGVNLAAVLDDTNDISIRRGAGLMLRKAVRDLVAEPRFGLTPISLGASVGLFEIRTADPDGLVAMVAAYLSTHIHYRYLTFVADCAALDQGFPAALALVTARNRFRQFRQPTLAVPAPGEGNNCCRFDQLSPGLAKTVKGADTIISPSALARFDFGRSQRKALYSDEIGDQISYEFTSDLADLSQPGAGQNFGNLNGKLAVIYLDGNRFGRLQRQCASPEALRAFDQTIQGYRREFLRALVDHAGRGDASFRNGARIRLETLLWGGDEILMVVPAWKGMETLQLFFDLSACWTFAEERLTHAGGLVFCHHKTPITQAVHAAKALADETKAVTRDDNRFDYLVLESVDYPTQSPADFRRIRYGAAAAALRPLAPFTAGSSAPWSERVAHIQGFLAGLPRGALYEMAGAWVSHRAAGGASDFATRVERMLAVNGEELEKSLGDRLFTYLIPEVDRSQGHDHAGWLHLVELWDYLAPDPAAGRTRR